jgi:ABC-type Fe3+ transport system permease subunit
VVIGSAVVLFIACCVLPVAYLLTFPLSTGDVSYRALWLDARQQGLLWNTARLGVGTALLATALGAPLGLALARINLRGKTLLRIVLAAPVLLPP